MIKALVAMGTFEELFRLDDFGWPVISDAMLKAEASDLMESPPLKRGAFTDDEASEASLVPKRSLRTLQKWNGIRSDHMLVNGRKQRMWSIMSVLKASLAHQMSLVSGMDYSSCAVMLHGMSIHDDEIEEYYGDEIDDLKCRPDWNDIRMLLRDEIMVPAYVSAISKQDNYEFLNENEKLVRACPLDYHLSIFNNKFVCLCVPDEHVQVFGGVGNIIPMFELLEKKVFGVFNVEAIRRIFRSIDVDYYDQIKEDLLLGEFGAPGNSWAVHAQSNYIKNNFTTNISINIGIVIRSTIRRMLSLENLTFE